MLAGNGMDISVSRPIAVPEETPMLRATQSLAVSPEGLLAA
jgi:hypothetical protein